MKVLFVFKFLTGGIATLNYNRAKALLPKGIKCHFLYLKQGSKTHLYSSEDTFIMSENPKIEKLINEHEYKAIVVCSDYTFLSKLNNWRYDGIVIYDFQGIGDLQLTKRWLSNAQRPVETYANAILYPKNSVFDELISTFYPYKTKFSFHNCIDLTLFTYKNVTSPDQIIIGWVGRIEENKNWREFLQIGAGLCAINLNVHLWMFIDDSFITSSDRKKFKKFVKKFKLESKLTSHNNIPHLKMPHYYSLIASSGGFVCSTSYLEGFGYSVLEAMSCQCPVLTTHSGGVESFVIHNITGKLYKIGHIHKAIEEGKEIIENKKLRTQIISNTQHTIKKQFTSEQYANCFLEMLKALS
ncbi:glycosyltransferase family 4 protein [Halalkalibacter hemicellulosilyticus]|uniref:Glycosyl transferase family 1 domain-containing protein n=1 Tax=Halalkalibacter hemicellulosilyticusJCM 9152 TaxID=1236971 RepID=W4QI38_9BACI|nr:glycosyltransferase family 4 protein [Halalkalibacter hemicellulosilyticus]GAE30979.1 hypothetical protein JCM9152_2413 [Halalkalibacter hemicellulosilyticusJCM 9152]